LKTNSNILRTAIRKLSLSLLLAASAAVAFATLGDGKVKKEAPRKSLLSGKVSLKPGAFTLQSGYSFRGSEVINSQDVKYINLNTAISFQQGHTTFSMPMKKKVSVNLNTQKNQLPSATVAIKF